MIETTKTADTGVEAATKLSAGRITDEGVERLRNLIGHEMRKNYSFNSEVARDTVKHFAWGIGDKNPLWTDAEYAASSELGVLAAPTSFLYTIHPTLVLVGLPGVHGFYAGCHWTVWRPLVVGDQIQTVTWISDVVEKQGKLGGRSVYVYFSTLFGDGEGRAIAEATGWSIRVDRSATRERKKLAVEPKVWNLEEIAPIEQAQLNSKIRGAEPRYWDDVEIGEFVGPLIKGPLNQTDMIAWYTGSQPAYTPAHEMALEYYQTHPKWAFRSQNGALEPNARVHDSLDAARAAGVPAPYDIGLQRQQWLFQLLTNWCGDAGFVKKCDASFRGFNYFGDVLWIGGTVIDKHVDADGEHVVVIETKAENQRDQDVMPGRAVVSLPRRGDHASPAARHVASTLGFEERLASVVPGLVRAKPRGATAP